MRHPVPDRALTLAGLLAFAALLFGAVLLHAQSHPDADESVIGVMAMNILSRGEHPTFFYGQAYGGGGAIEAYLAALIFAFTGPSAIALKTVILLLWLVTLAACFRFCDRFFDRATAVCACLVLTVASPLVEWHLKARGGYVGVVLCCTLALHCYAELLQGPHRSAWRFGLLGLCCGVGYYNLELIVPFLLALLLASLAHWRWFWRPRAVLGAAVGFVIGLGPSIAFNLTHQLVNLRYVYHAFRAPSRELHGLPRVLSLFGTCVPRFLSGRNLDRVVDTTRLQTRLEYAAYGLLLAALCLTVLPRAWRWLRARDAQSPVSVPLELETLLLGYVVLYLVMQCISKGPVEPRYLVPLFPALAILSARSALRLASERGWPGRAAAVLLLGTVLGGGLVTHVRHLGPSYVTDKVELADGRVLRLATSGDTVPALLRYLQEHHLTRVWCLHQLQWRLMFESQLQVLASDWPLHDELVDGAVGLTPAASCYRQYDELVAAPPGPTAIILHHEDARWPALLARPFMRHFTRRTMIGEYVVMSRAGG